ncbi:SCO family protein [Nocardioides pantholopis]|uniref:SCO family protein n=1 Tax=Nocardioides pantholopis TaxID=2483798 RepID=UPI000F08BA73|nr:SCO family protein [Nocardioides pantholopis]
MRRATAALLGLVLAVLLAGCGGEDKTTTELSGSRVDPPFEVAATPLTDTDGEQVSLAEDLDKRLTLVFFGYTQCPDVCPATMATISSALTRLDDAEREQVGMVFVSTDPSRDTAPVLRRYLDRFDPTFTGLTGDLDPVVELAKSMGVFVAGAEELASGGYDLGSHGSQVFAVQADGTAPIFWQDQDTSSAELAADLETLLGDA